MIWSLPTVSSTTSRRQERAGAIDYIYRALRPGGLMAFWENNPWNPGTRYVMSRIPFDRDAITLSAREAQGLIRTGGLDVLRTDFLFIFPKGTGLLPKTRTAACKPAIRRSVSRIVSKRQFMVLRHLPVCAAERSFRPFGNWPI